MPKINQPPRRNSEAPGRGPPRLGGQCHTDQPAIAGGRGIGSDGHSIDLAGAKGLAPAGPVLPGTDPRTGPAPVKPGTLPE